MIKQRLSSLFALFLAGILLVSTVGVLRIDYCCTQCSEKGIEVLVDNNCHELEDSSECSCGRQSHTTLPNISHNHNDVLCSADRLFQGYILSPDEKESLRPNIDQLSLWVSFDLFSADTKQLIPNIDKRHIAVVSPSPITLVPSGREILSIKSVLVI